ncbi:MAG: transcriptional repressor [Candidatus Marinimicrobia bacterium]|nr:transcriptional repressor [Candidatus Neomarinimicrobiota bacterium]
MRYSHQREEILKIVQSTRCHPTADWVYDEVRKVIPNVSLGTVYRNLNQLVNTNNINALNDGPVIRYDGFMEMHDHFKCKKCDTIYDIDHHSMNIIYELNQNTNHTISNYSLNLEGICCDCVETTNN